jgi:protein phosphatase
MSVKPGVEEDLMLVLDGPAAAALAEPVPAQPAPVAAATYRLDIGSATSPGRVRKRNEDSFLVHQWSWCNLDRRRDMAAIVVADGLGGHEAGDQASGMAIRQIGAELAPLFRGALSGQITDPAPALLAETIERSIKETNRAVHRRGQTEAGCRGMGATAVVVLIWDGQVKIGHVGDCRVYHQGADKLTQVTRDQTLVERMVELGQLTPKEALTHPARSEVLQAIGNYAEIAPASYQLQLLAGDWVIVACDGLHTHVNAGQLQESICRAAPAAAALAQQLVDLANQGGGTDNCTVVAVRCY